MPTADYIADRLQDLLDAATAGLTAARTGNVAPSRSYVGWGRPAVDICDDPNTEGLLVVYLEPGRGLWHRSVPNAALPKTLQIAPVLVLVTELWRCYPTSAEDMAAPPAATLTTASKALARDLWALMTILYVRMFAGTLWTEGTCEGTRILEPAMLGPEGGSVGFRVSVEHTINDPGPS